jgi:hypothetical protein
MIDAREPDVKDIQRIKRVPFKRQDNLDKAIIPEPDIPQDLLIKPAVRINVKKSQDIGTLGVRNDAGQKIFKSISNSVLKLSELTKDSKSEHKLEINDEPDVSKKMILYTRKSRKEYFCGILNCFS